MPTHKKWYGFLSLNIILGLVLFHLTILELPQWYSHFRRNVK